MAHQSSCMSRMWHPTKQLCQVITATQDDWDLSTPSCWLQHRVQTQVHHDVAVAVACRAGSDKLNEACVVGFWLWGQSLQFACGSNGGVYFVVKVCATRIWKHQQHHHHSSGTRFTSLHLAAALLFEHDQDIGEHGSSKVQSQSQPQHKTNDNSMIAAMTEEEPHPTSKTPSVTGIDAVMDLIDDDEEDEYSYSYNEDELEDDYSYDGDYDQDEKKNEDTTSSYTSQVLCPTLCTH